MRKLAPSLLAGTAVLALGATTLPTAQAAPASNDNPAGSAADGHHRLDNRPFPQAKQRAKLRAKAVEMLQNGSATLRPQADGGSTVKLADGTYVEFPIEKQDTIFTILSDFGTQGSGRYGTAPGPVHNQIPQPDRSQDNSTYWVPDFNKAHYEEMFNGDGESFKNYYQNLSSGRYTATNTVSDWVQVPGNASTYGDNAVENNGGAWAFIGDSANAWYKSQLDAGKTPAEIDDYLSQFDVWDRDDYDHDGDFNEPDGYIDHFQAVHAGGGEEAGAGDDAIWSHRWYAFPNLDGSVGPTVNGSANLAGGTQIGQSKYFIGDYTVEPENGGLGVFAHEFGHDLGLPDFYDTAGGENGTAFWTLMSSGSWLNDGGDDIGTTPGLMGPEEKLYLGWLDYSEVGAGQSGTYNLGPSQHTYDNADQAVKVDLPDSVRTQSYTTPPEGTHAWYTGRGDDLNNTLTRQVSAADSVTVTSDAWYDIEAGFDYLYAEYSLDGGATWTKIGKGLTGAHTKWGGIRFSYKPAGQPSLFRFRYATDGGVNEAGAFLDNIAIKADKATFTDGAENGDNGWTVNGWKASTGTETAIGERYYLLESRQYVGYDATLENGPYQFSEGITRPNWVERFPFQNGMLVWMVDQGVADNNTSEHPGFGYAIPVDARPDSLTYPDGTSPSNRREPFDATFGLEATDQVCLHKQVVVGKGQSQQVDTLAACAEPSAAMPTFDDSNPDAYWNPANPQNSVKVAGLGVTATVTADNGGFLTVDVNNPAN
ncbi:MAG TPA: immune inhibitor A domain-containing protein [Nocardioidaceae bacterium]|nr:immune inhibitor A domain-containing protein [Nocardioidaceae bacterium]